MEYKIVRTQEEIDNVVEELMNSQNEGTKFSGMIYEDGCLYMFQWLIGESDESPMAD